MSRIRSSLSIVVILFATSCSRPAEDASDAATAAHTDDAQCRDLIHVATLTDDLDEASGIAWSRSRPNLLWANNDSADPDVVFALDTLGRITQKVRLSAALTDRDLEDIAIARCGDHDCIFLADIGDNLARRPFLRILRFDEPRSTADSVATPTIFPFRFPDGSHDAEAMFVMPGERVFVITKGRNAPVALFRYPGPLRPDTVTLEHVQDLSTGLAQLPDMVTAASVSPAGDHIALRTYSSLRLFAFSADGRLVPDPAGSSSLAAAQEGQGEGMTIDDQGRVFLVGERGLDGAPPPMWKMTCRIAR